MIEFSKFHEKKEVLHTELAPYPASMFNATGNDANGYKVDTQ